MVRTFSGTARPVRWIGHRRIDLTRHSNPSHVRPIRIRADAFADGVPERDLLVSPDHAIHYDGLLIPARLLRNDATILSEERCRSVRYFHVELDAHDILLAEGLPAESYLDTGGGDMFDNARPSCAADPDARARRESLSCLPFADDAARVEPVWRKLAVRAWLMGHVPPDPVTTDDPALHLAVNGHDVWPARADGDRHRFVVPPLAGAVRLVSLATAPCELTPWNEDQRRLGVRVGRIVVSGNDRSAEIALDHPSLTAGWWDAEADEARDWRWTDGNARLRLPGWARLLDVYLIGGGTWRLDAAAVRRSGPVAQRRRDLADDAVPIARCPLAEQPRGRIPRAVVTVP